MNTCEKEHAYQQQDPSAINQHREQGAMYTDVIDPPANVDQDLDYEIPGDEATTGSHNHQQSPTSAANVNQNSTMVDKVLSDYMTVITDGASNSNQEA